MNRSVLKDGRRWSVRSGGIPSLRRKYQVILDGITPTDGETETFPGVPAIGSKHPLLKYLEVQSYDVEEGEGKDKTTIIVWVNYARVQDETTGSGEDEQTLRVTEWGWDAGTDQKELTTDADGKAVLNTAGDVFDSVPRVSTYSPTFTKVMKFVTRQGGAMAHNCKTNESEVTIGGVKYPPRTLLCSVSERRIFGDGIWNYQYTVNLKYKSNLVRVEWGEGLTDIGWDVAIASTGMRAKDRANDDKLDYIRKVDRETGKLGVVSSPWLLDNDGYALSETDPDPQPYNMRFKAYATTTFPTWFYSEPPVAETNEPNEGI